MRCLGIFMDVFGRMTNVRYWMLSDLAVAHVLAGALPQSPTSIEMRWFLASMLLGTTWLSV